MVLGGSNGDAEVGAGGQWCAEGAVASRARRAIVGTALGSSIAAIIGTDPAPMPIPGFMLIPVMPSSAPA